MSAFCSAPRCFNALDRVRLKGSILGSMSREAIVEADMMMRVSGCRGRIQQHMKTCVYATR